MNHLTKIIINRLTVDDDDDVDSFLDERLILVTVWDVNINVILVGFKWFFFVVFFFLVPSAIWLHHNGETADISTVSQVPKTPQITPKQSRWIIILG